MRRTWGAALALGLMLGCDGGGAEPPTVEPADVAPEADDGRPDAARDAMRDATGDAFADASVDAAPVALDAAADAMPDAALDAAPDAMPDAAPDAMPDACLPDCPPGACGADGCGGLCPLCPAEAPLCVEGICAPPPPVRINEVVTANADGLRDVDGETSDWIELHNAGPDPVDLDGWFLTDDAADLARWALPPITLGPRGFVVVFASDADRPDPVEPHTSFRLSSAGEFLALVMPDGVTVVDAYDPATPALPDDTAHGVAQVAERIALIPPGAPLPYRPAVEGDLGPAAADFDDGDWPAAPGGLGVARVQPPEPDAIEELAGGRPTAQTSTLNGFTADRGANGDLGDFTHTVSDDLEPAWTVDLGGPRWIGRVVLHNRRGCCGSRLRDITVEVLDGDGAVVYASPLLNPENADGDGLDGPPRIELDLIEDGGVVGAAVRVRRAPDPDLSGTAGAGNADEAAVLSLGEVEVFGGAGASLARIVTDLGDALGDAPGLWVRARFEVPPDTPLDTLALDITWDAGFVAWLDGIPVAARDAPAPEALADGMTPWRATVEPAGARSATLALTPPGPGAHVLAVLVLDADVGDPGRDLVIDLALEGQRIVDGARAFFDAPTPGRPNTEPGFAGFVSPVRFSHPGGFYDAPFEVELTADPPDATIHYTTDGTPPGPDDPVYVGPIPVDGITTLRAAAFREGYRDAAATAATWLFLDEVIAQDADATLARGFPPMWGGTAPDYGMDPRVTGPDDDYGGRYADAMRDSLLAIPTVAFTADLEGIFGPDGIYTRSGERGVAWERAVSMEYIVPEGARTPHGPEAGDGFQIECGLRIQGGAFRSHGLTKKHSFRVLFKGIYGPTKLRFPFFGPDADDTLDGFTLRANSNDGWQWVAAGGQPLFVRDSLGRALHRAMGGVSSAESWVHVYINGVYWGLYNPVERPDAAFGTHSLGGERDAWDAVSNGQAADGDTQAWSRLLQMADDGLGELVDLWMLEGKGPDGTRDPALPVWLDVDPYIDYMLTNIWLGNSDWPHKNWWVGRPRDGAFGFRFFMWDAEWSVGLRSNLGTNKIEDRRGVAIPWVALLENPEFRARVADRVQRHFSPGGVFYVDPAAPAWDPEAPARNAPAARFVELAGRVALPLVAESARWGDQHADRPYTVDEHWAVERDRQLAEYFPARSARVLEHLRQAGLVAETPTPAADPEPGPVPAGAVLALTAEAGDVWFTIDGPDPRLPGGAAHPEAIDGGPAVEVALPPGPVTVRARAFGERGWSALFEGTYAPLDP